MIRFPRRQRPLLCSMLSPAYPAPRLLIASCAEAHSSPFQHQGSIPLKPCSRGDSPVASGLGEVCCMVRLHRPCGGTRGGRVFLVFLSAPASSPLTKKLTTAGFRRAQRRTAVQCHPSGQLIFQVHAFSKGEKLKSIDVQSELARISDADLESVLGFAPNTSPFGNATGVDVNWL